MRKDCNVVAVALTVYQQGSGIQHLGYFVVGFVVRFGSHGNSPDKLYSDNKCDKQYANNSNDFCPKP